MILPKVANNDFDQKSGYASILLKGAFFNTGGWLWPVVLSLFATPIIVRGLGVEAYGLLSILGLVMGYLGSLASPVGAASVKYLADAYGKRDRKAMGRAISASLVSQGCIGGFVGLILFVSASWLSTEVFHVSPELVPTAVLMFQVGSLGFALNSILGVVQSIPVALQRFDVSNLVNIVVGTASYVVMILLLALGFGLREIIFAQPVTSMLGILMLVALSVHLLPGVRWFSSVDRSLLLGMFGFGFWILVNQLASLFTFQLGKTVVAISLDTTLVTYFAIPSTLAMYLQVFASKLSAVFFPLSAEMLATNSLDKLQILYVRAMRLLVFVIGGVAVAFIALGPLLLRYWVGQDFELKSSSVLAWLAVWGLWHSLGAIPDGIAKGSGHPEISGMAAILFGLTNILATVLLVSRFGIVGAAMGAALSTCVASPVFIGYIQTKILKLNNWRLVRNPVVPFLIVGGLTGVSGRFLLHFADGFLPAVLASVLTGAIYCGLSLVFKLIDVETITSLWLRLLGTVRNPSKK
jgi:O-antigen/teichoic acid export membrane protein